MAPKQSAVDPQYLDEHHQRISEFGADYFDDDEERDEFISTLMSRRGYQRNEQRIVEWLPPAPADGGQNGSQGGGGAAPQRRAPAYFKR